MMMKVVIATHNKDKLKELKKGLSSLSVHLMEFIRPDLISKMTGSSIKPYFNEKGILHKNMPRKNNLPLISFV